MGLHTGKIMDFATKTKTCRSFDHAKRLNKEPSIHDCRKNHTGSSKAMELISAVELCSLPLKICSASITMTQWLKSFLLLPTCKESFNSVVGSKNPKIRFYSGSESNDFHVACAVAQINTGYGYVDRTLEALGVDPGLNCTRYTLGMEKKKNQDCQRKNSLGYKKRRNQLHNRRIHGIARKEKQGKTCETNIGLNIHQTTVTTKIDHQLDRLLDERISEETLNMYEQTVSPFTPRTSCPAMIHDCKLFYNIILIPKQTPGKAAQLCQLGATNKSGCNSFSEYILPSKDINKYATN